MRETRRDDASRVDFGPGTEIPVAIIGIGCRFPGGVDSADALWRALAEGRDLVTEVPPQRWDADAIYDPEPGVPGKLASRWGAFIDDVAGFEPAFFGLTEHEAERMDPQSRLLLETACEALEHAGLPPHGLSGSATGVFAGHTHDDYLALTNRDEPGRWDAHSVIGTDRSSATGRISFLLGLRGPAVTLDSSGSSSLVAVHLGCQALRTGEVDLALAGGVTLDLTPESAFTSTTMGMLSPTGRCGAFGADADGIVSGEGCGMVALKRLTDAVADGDRVLAVLRGTGVNHHGRASDTMTGPSAEGQRRLQEEVLARAGVDPARVGLIEAHGAGTPSGDPVEYAALRASYGAGEEGCALGSVKTNLGHCEAAAGIAGLIKAVMAIRHGQVPANLHFTGWNPRIDAEGARLFVPTGLLPWPVTTGPRLAAVSSHGASGTNAHVLLEQAPAAESAPAAEPGPRLYPLSAGSEEALAATAGRVADWLEGDGADVPLRDVGHTLAHRRETRVHRAAISASSRTELIDRLRRLAARDPADGVWTGTSGRRARGPVFVFSGQGAVWAGLGRTLLAAEPAFAAAVDTLEPVVAAEAGFSVHEALTGGDGGHELPVLFVTQVALAAAWRDRGVEPTAVIGHAMGEVAAAVVAGALTPADGAAVVCRASRLLGGAADQSATARVELAYGQVRAQLTAAGVEDVTVTAIPSPSSTVISGDAGHVRSLVAAWGAKDVAAQIVPDDPGLGGGRAEAIRPELSAALAGLNPREPDLTFYSTVLSDPYSTPAFDAAYWAQAVRGPVRFAAACVAALADGRRTFVEVSPDPLLCPAVRENAKRMGRDATVLPTLTRGQEEPSGLMGPVATAYCAGVPVTWREHAEGTLADVPLPLWAKRRLWLPDYLRRRRDADRHQGRPLLGTHIRLPDAPGEHLWQADAGTAVWPWLRDHQIEGRAAMPGAGYAEMALGVAADLFGERVPCEIGDLNVHATVFLDEHTLLTTRGVRLTPETASVEFLADVDGRARRVASATVRRLPAEPAPVWADLRAALAGRRYDGSALPDDDGLRHGPSFAALDAVHPPAADGETVLGRISLPAGLRAAAGRFRAHPVLLHACLRTVSAHPSVQGVTFVPLRVGTLRRLQDPSRAAWCEARVHAVGDDGARADVRLLAEDGAVLVELLDVQLGAVARDASAARARDRLLAIEWDELPAPGLPAPNTGAWLVLAEEDDQLADTLAGALGSALLVTPLSYRDMGAEAVHRHLTDRHGRVVMLCPAPVEAVGVDTVERARDRVRRLTDLVRTLAGVGDEPRLYVVTREARTPDGAGVPNLEQAPLRAVCRVAGAEHPRLRVTAVDVEAGGGDPADLVAELLADSAEDEVAWRGGTRYAARLRPAPLGPDERRTTQARCGQDGYAPAVRTRGHLDSIELVTARRRPPGPGEIEIRVHAAGLSFHDVRVAADLTQGESAPFGLDCAGEVTAAGEDVTGLRPGDRVAAFVPGAMASFVTLRSCGAFRVPPAMSYEDAATIPAAYLLAAHAVRHLARLQPGERILIHSATGGVGMAAIALAQAAGARIHATAGSEERRDLLRAMGVEHVYDSRTLDFAEQVRADTGGEGVDVVVNALEGIALQAGLDLLRPGGRLIDVGGSSRDRLRLSPPRHNVTFAGVDLATAGDRLPALTGPLMREIGEEVTAGVIQPLPHTAYPVGAVAEAFQVMAAREHTGKLVIVFPVEGTVTAIVPPAQVPVARADGAYVITGGLGGLGLLLARHLAEGGAGRIVLGDRDRPAGEAGRVIEALRQAGTDVGLVRGDLSDPATAPRLIAAATATGLPLRGVAHAADAAEEAAISRIDDDLLDRVWAPKAFGAWHLFRAGAGQPLDWWLSFSSSAALIGDQGQAAYAAADGWLDAFTAYGRARGVPVQSINWGVRAARGPHAPAPVSPADRVAAIELVLRHDRPQTGYLPFDDARMFIGDRLRTTPFFAALTGRPAGGQLLRIDLRAADPGTRHTRITEYIVAQSSRILHRDRAELDPDSPLTESGLDSMSALELRSGIERGLGIRIPAQAIWDHGTPAALAAHLAAHIGDRG
jgi:acyl transferase domain-containing protein/NADPH:quinone reductase-like Zn-dependent oxidoreductase/NAD(P)-dependent dehydrogenase (short-subunit alcohol dehydrogenase family)/acyl carrier protein